MTDKPATKRRRLIGMGFVIAFVLSTATIIYTGLNVRAPGSHRTEPAAAEAPAQESEVADAEAQDSEAAEAAER